MECLDDRDDSIRLRALDLISGMVTKKNLVEIVRKLVSHMDASESASECQHTSGGVNYLSYLLPPPSLSHFLPPFPPSPLPPPSLPSLPPPSLSIPTLPPPDIIPSLPPPPPPPPQFPHSHSSTPRPLLTSTLLSPPPPQAPPTTSQAPPTSSIAMATLSQCGPPPWRSRQPPCGDSRCRRRV